MFYRLPTVGLVYRVPGTKDVYARSLRSWVAMTFKKLTGFPIGEWSALGKGIRQSRNCAGHTFTIYEGSDGYIIGRPRHRPLGKTNFWGQKIDRFGKIINPDQPRVHVTPRRTREEIARNWGFLFDKIEEKPRCSRCNADIQPLVGKTKKKITKKKKTTRKRTVKNK